VGGVVRYRSKPVEVEAMQWEREEFDDDDRGYEATAPSIVAWVKANGGEARYVPAWHHARIAVRTINGWAYARPGHYVVKGSATFMHESGVELTDFYPCDPETFEKRWEAAL
jgi:hypothetical protein